VRDSDGASDSVTSATFDFSHPSNLSVNHPVSPVTEGLSPGDRERLVPDSALSNHAIQRWSTRVMRCEYLTGGDRWPSSRSAR